MPIQMADELPTLAGCRALLGEANAGMTDQEVFKLREDLANIAEVIILAIQRGTPQGAIS